MPLSGACHRLWTNPRSSSRRSAGSSVPSLRSKNPFDLSRSSRRIWNPYFSPLARRAKRHSWIDPFFSSAVHSGETSAIGLASYPGRAIWPFGARDREVGHRSPGAAMLGTSWSTDHRGKKRKRKGATRCSLRRASRPGSQVERGDDRDSDDGDLDQQDAERRQVETRREGRHERFRAHRRIVDDRLTRGIQERGPDREALEDRAAAAHEESGPTLDLEPHPLLDAVDRHVRGPGEAADARPMVVEHDLVAGVDLWSGEVRHRARILPPGIVPTASGVAVVRGMDEVHGAVGVVVPENQMGLERESVPGVREVPAFDDMIVFRAHDD